MAAMSTDLAYAEDEFSVPEALVENYDVFCEVLSLDTWKNVLSKEDREHLQKFLPTFPESSDQNTEIQETLSRLFSRESFHFGSPLQLAWRQLNAGEFLKDMAHMKAEQKRQQKRLNQQEKRSNFLKMFEVLFNRHQSLLEYSVGSEEGEGQTARRKKKDRSTVEENAAKRFRELMTRFHKEHQDSDSSDDELQFLTKPQTSLDSELYSKSWYHRLLRQRDKKLKSGSAVVETTKGCTLDDVVRRDQAVKDGWEWEVELTLPSKQGRRRPAHSPRPPATKHNPDEPADSSLDESDLIPAGTKERMFPIHDGREYKKFVGVKSDIPVELKEDLPEGDLYMSFFSLIRCVFLSIKGCKGELSKVEKKVGQWQRSSEHSQCKWAKLQPSWIPLVQSALSYLAAEVGAVSSTDPLPGFMPVIEFRDRVDHWRWIGFGRDSDVELHVLFKHWVDTLDDAETVIDYSDYLPPVIGGERDIPLLTLTPEQLESFHLLEQQRYMSPHKAFRLNLHGYEAVVGPLKGVPKQGIAMSKAREHFLLKSERPSVVTILSLARDAASRLPNGEGTRADICNLVRESQYVQEVTDAQINAAVSGALDRLHYEKDPCVRYDSSRKLWIYLHRARAEEDFERIHQVVELANQNRKKLMSKPVRMRILLPSGKEVDLDNDVENRTGIASELQPRSAPVIKTSGQKQAKSRGVGAEKRPKRRPKAKNTPSPQKARLITKGQTGMGTPQSQAPSNTFPSASDLVAPSSHNMQMADSQEHSRASLSMSSSASSEEEDFPLITPSAPQVPPTHMLMEDVLDGKSHLEALEQIFASDSDSEEEEEEEEEEEGEGASGVKPTATAGNTVMSAAVTLEQSSEGSDTSSSSSSDDDDEEMHVE